MMKAVYSEEFREQALRKIYGRGQRTIRAVADELNMNHFTLKNWMKQAPEGSQRSRVSREKRPQSWSLEERLAALQESHSLEGEALNAWCRGKGLYAHQLAQWKAEFCAGQGEERAGGKELRRLKEGNQRLQRELLRKEKALAEAAALLVLQKKYQALWGDGVE